MSVLAMKRIMICGLRKDRKAVLEEVQRQGLLEVHSVSADDEVFQRIPMPITGSEFERNIHDAEAALEVLENYESSKGGLLASFKGREIMDVPRYDQFKAQMPKIQSVIRQILNKSKKIAENNAEILRCRQQIDMLVPWKTLDIALDTNGTEQTGIFIGALPGEQSIDEVYAVLKDVMPVDVTIFSKDRTQTCLMVICQASQKEQTSALLRSVGFAYPSVNSHRTPAQATREMEKNIEKLTGQIEDTEKEIRELIPFREDIRFYADYMSIRAEKYNVTNSLPQSEHTFVL